MSSTSIVPATAVTADELTWYKDVVIYQVHVRSFFDSNGDGIGDFPGLTSKLDYIQALGVGAIWLLPFYPSPLKDEGYDIADYGKVHSAYGTLEDFREFLDEAHSRGLKVITELVINHTSDQHPWFQRARQAPVGSPERNYYVWSDTPERYDQVRIIFSDFESSNWSWDAVAKQYYWHRFYSHQPDLNFDSLDVQREVFAVADFWLGMGVDGLRLDAIPYLYERDGTSCESLPETHGFLRLLRAHLNEHFPGRMLLAEANQWPDETAAFFGEGDECHMCFHFPLMPRLFLAVQQENRFPIVDILRQTPVPPGTGQWAIFLRNHDELTLEMVSEEERLLMYRTYADDPQSRVNLGVRRRLAPLLKNDRRRLELLHALLLSLPGTPVLYYGDELRMGDDIYLKDRDAVRTPMQWTPDRNAGFSSANPQRLFSRPIIDPEYHYQTINVETQEASPHSFLWWLRRMVHIRRRYPTFGRGTLQFLPSKNPHIISFLRQLGENCFLVVANLSRVSQYVELDLHEFRGRSPMELIGQTRFPQIGELPYLLTLGPHNFYWFQLTWPPGGEVRLQTVDLPKLTLETSWRELFNPSGRRRLARILPEHLSRQPWFPYGLLRIRQAEVTDYVDIPAAEESGDHYLICLVRVQLTDGTAETYQLLLLPTNQERAALILNDRPYSGLAQLAFKESSESAYLCDATAESGFWKTLLNLNGHHPRWESGSELRLEEIQNFRQSGISNRPIRNLARMNLPDSSAAVVEGCCFVTLFRRVESGQHPEEEFGRAMQLSELPSAAPMLYGALRLQPRLSLQSAWTLGLVEEQVIHEQTATQLLGDLWQRLIEECCTPLLDQPLGESEPVPHFSPDALGLLAALNTRHRRLGNLLGEWHVFLSSLKGEMAGEAITTHYRRSAYESIRSAAALAFDVARAQTTSGGDAVATIWDTFISLQDRLAPVLRGILLLPVGLLRIRCHGALTTDSLLSTGDNFCLVNWGGDRRLPLGERRLKRCALRDLAMLICSLVTLYQQKISGLTSDRAQQLRVGQLHDCLRTTMRELIDAYAKTVAGHQLIPATRNELVGAIRAFVVHAATEQFLSAVRHDDKPAQENALQLFVTIAAVWDRPDQG